MSKKQVCCGATAVSFGMAILAVAVAMLVWLPDEIQRMIQSELTITTPTSKPYDTFFNFSSKASLYEAFNFFNCTNLDDVITKNAKPKFTQVGPYTYKKIKVRPEEYIRWHPNATVTYKPNDTWIFEPSMSSGDEHQDIIYTVDLGILGVLKQYRLDPAFDFLALFLVEACEATNTTSIFTRRSVHELLWGYDDPVLDYVKSKGLPVSPRVGIQVGTIGTGTNGQYTGGKASKYQPPAPKNSVGVYTMWNDMTVLPYWGTPECNQILGTDGSTFPPNQKENSQVNVFVDTLYRSAQLKTSETTDYQGVKLLRFRIAEENLLSGAVNPFNKGFNINVSGVQPAPDKLSAPIAFSKPFCYDCLPTEDQKALFAFEYENMLSDVKESYDTILDVEPNTGTLCRVHKRIQVQTYIEQMRYRPMPENLTYYQTIPVTAGIPTLYWPVVWADEHLELGSNLMDDIKKDVLKPIKAAHYGSIAGVVLGALLGLVGAMLMVRGCQRSQEEQSSSAYVRETDHLVNKGV